MPKAIALSSSQNLLPIITITIFFFFTVLYSKHVQSQTNDTYNDEKTILLQLLDQGSNSPFLNPNPRSPSSDHCSWPEVTCTNGSVTGINFQQTFETIPPLICNLKNLTSITLRANFIPVKFPTFLCNCSKLKHLDLSRNSFTGIISENIDGLLFLSHLEYLDLSYNYFNYLPPAIGRLSSLKCLNLSHNQFSRGIPLEFGNLSNLIYMDLSFCEFSGAVPDEIGHLSNLIYMDLSSNEFSGVITPEFGNLSNLSYMDLSKNEFSGAIPPEFGNLSNLSFMNLSKNEFLGAIPPEFGNLLNLSYMDLSKNEFSGAIPPEFGNLSNLNYMNLSKNEFSGAIPPEFGNLLNLSYMDLSKNEFSGAIPPEFGNLSNLSYMDLSKNELSGAIPLEFGNLSNLSHLDLQDNRFVGTIPSEIGRLLNLRYMDLSLNHFFGEILIQNGSLSSLSYLDLSINTFSNIPPEIGSLSNLDYLNLSNNEFSGEIPPEIWRLSILLTLDLSQNKFSGEIPPEIECLSSIRTLDLSHNELSGKVPIEIWFPVQYSVDLHCNRLCLGCIPPKFDKAKIKYLEFLTVCPDNPNNCNPNHLSNSKPRFAAILSAAIVTVLLIMVFAFYIFTRFNFKRYKSDSTWKLVIFQKLNFTEETIFSSLTDTNLIGSGGSGNVYKVEIHSSGQYVAVKKIHDNLNIDKRLEKQFLSEVQILGNIRHLNILKLMCYISSRNSKLLVYEYMENGSLDQWIHSNNASLPNVVLEWQKRLKIAIATADGLCYMHHYSSSPIVHCDLKSSNILLDSEFNAKIADFGIARILENDGDPRTMSVVAGTFRYIAPEYAQTARVTEKVNVYSFGVILLELVTGRRAHRGDENSSLVEWAWNHIQQENQIVDALDEEIKELNHLDEMIKVFKLGIYCTNALPSRRPKMNEVVQILHRCANPLAPGQNLIPEFRESVPQASKLLFLYQNLLKFRVFKLSSRSA